VFDQGGGEELPTGEPAGLVFPAGGLQKMVGSSGMNRQKQDAYDQAALSSAAVISLCFGPKDQAAQNATP